ncbi:NADP-dependent oxidoreductase [Catenuloplanes atrovinosus]|uniref:NADPH:quinone reductase-like Zn-dependent oxidoreductase n=1 Tax=Catenuloplanes atrovinosus TaxID=137266 RepID=A0AAE4CBL3_9ACTN|nr:NADP-dependent oxidoreductase [Catenuloplanes atrovinosus]MDR7275715.1 NADPH:quinone reductase-like Zn-dependent oxidoreductase [Catenuloplanes atrovinosus]
MKALLISDYGDPPRLADVAEPVPGDGEVPVQVSGAALNPLDLKMAAGHLREFFPVRFPYTLGTDIAGVVARAGHGWAAGDRVVARLDPRAGGALAELAAVPADQLVPAPASVPLSTAAGAATAAATAWQALTEVAAVRPGQRVLVQGAAGGVGSFAVQLAHRLGAHVIATASPAGLAIAEELGADEVIDYTAGPLAARVRGVDVVIDTVGGRAGEQALDVLVPGGLLVAVPAPPDAERAASRGVRAAFVFHESDAARLGTVVTLLDDGLRVLVDRRLPLADAAGGLTYLARGHAKGKIIVGT